MNSITHILKEYPMASAFVQFAVLGSIGEWITLKIAGKGGKLNSIQIILKIAAWGFLGIIIKYGFFGYKSMLNSFVEAGYFPKMIYSTSFTKALSISIIVNALFGPIMMYIHRIMDNIIEKKWTFIGMDKAVITLFWFWIPAHTVTFILPNHLQITLAALWSLVLGVIMGYAKKNS